MTLPFKAKAVIAGWSAVALWCDMARASGNWAIQGRSSGLFNFAKFDDPVPGVISGMTSDAQSIVILSDSLTDPSVASHFRSFAPQFASQDFVLAA